MYCSVGPLGFHFGAERLEVRDVGFALVLGDETGLAGESVSQGVQAYFALACIALGTCGILRIG
jgi:hypothetical protein